MSFDAANTISVVVPVYNRADVVGSAIDSILSQALPGVAWSLEIVLVDDGSTDGLGELLRRYDARVRPIRHSSNQGAAAARNSGIEAARGFYVAFLDSDDIWLPGKLKAQLSYMSREAVAASCTAFVLTRPRAADIVAPKLPTKKLGLADLVWGSFVSPGSTLICERGVYSKIGMLDTGLKRLEDWDWLIRYGSQCQLGFLSEPLARVEASVHKNAAHVLSALDVLSARWSQRLPKDLRPAFGAALEMERGAALYRQGEVVRGLTSVLKSLLAKPLGHQSLAAVLHNRFARN